MITISVYKTETGEILRQVGCPDNMASAQCGQGESFYKDCPAAATHIISGVPTTITVVPSNELLLSRIRAERNAKLTACDWTQLPDAPADKAEWAAYRQALRDMPGQCDPNNPTWPVPPV